MLMQVPRTATRRALVHVGDPALGDAIRGALEAAGWACADPGNGAPHPHVLLIELSDPPAASQRLIDVHPQAVVVLLARDLSPDVMRAAHAVHASAIVTRATPLGDLPLVLAAHVR